MHSLFDLTSMLEVPMDVLQKRLLERWANLPEDLAQQKIAANDLPNARLVIEHSRPADFTISLPAS
jgi:pantothenate kinase